MAKTPYFRNRKAVIDVGSNSVKLFVGELTADGTIETVLDTSEIVRLAEGLDRTGRINPEPMRRNAEAVARFAERARALGADEIAAVGTMALRRASNAAEFTGRVKEACGVDVRVIPGEEEARLSYLAVLSCIPIGDEEIVIFDTGGGSTEFIFGRGTELIRRFSVNLGAVRLTENYLKSDPVTADEVSAAIAEIEKEFAEAGATGAPDRLIGIGGSVNVMSAVKHKMIRYDPGVIRNSTLSREDIAAQIAAYSARTIEQRKEIPGLPAKRADIILAGACIAKVILDRFCCGELTVSDRGVRHGLAFELFRT